MRVGLGSQVIKGEIWEQGCFVGFVLFGIVNNVEPLNGKDNSSRPKVSYRSTLRTLLSPLAFGYPCPVHIEVVQGSKISNCAPVAHTVLFGIASDGLLFHFAHGHKELARP